MKRSRLLLVAGVLLALAVLGTFALSHASDRTRGAGGETGAHGAGDPPGASSGDSSAGRADPSQSAETPRRRGDGQGEGSEQPPPDAGDRTADGAGAEISAGSGAAGYRLPNLKRGLRAGPLVRAPLPPSSSREGGLVRGYPEALAVVPGARIRSSSVSGQGRRLQVALDANVDRSAVGVERFHRTRLARLGFVGSPVPAVGGSTAVGFRRGPEHLVLTLTPRGRHATAYTLFGTLRVGA